jgi:SAM-dependent methyltransferase
MAELVFSDYSRRAPTVRRALDANWRSVRNASLAIHPDDDMYAFDAGLIGDPALSATVYFRAGASMLDVIDAVAEWHFGGLDRVGSFLDFAAGYGRATRFFAERLGSERVTVGEVQLDALEFQAQQFKVATLPSTTDPAGLDSHGRRYSFVFVASLFSHLPRSTFTQWLAKLWELVEPGGVLVFSVHDEVLNEGGAPWQDGHAFIAASEIADLETADYGTAYTTEAFVREQLALAVGEAADNAVRLPRALCFAQDVWVVPRGRANPAPLRYECGPHGAMDLCAVDGDTVTLSGWTADAGDCAVGAATHPIATVELQFSDGTRADAQLGRSTPEIAQVFKRAGDGNFENAGWNAEVHLGRRARARDIVTIVSTCAHGRSFVLDCARLGDAMARTSRQPMGPGPFERRWRTARSVYAADGPLALARLIPTVARNERHRLSARIRSAGRRH